MIKIDINDLDKYFQKGELIPAIAFDVDTKTVLMLAYMNRESLRKTLETGYTWYWSRSRQELWNKGATSGHLQKVISIYSDCDNDTLLLNVKQTGVACHTGSYSCFFKCTKAKKTDILENAAYIRAIPHKSVRTDAFLSQVEKCRAGQILCGYFLDG